MNYRVKKLAKLCMRTLCKEAAQFKKGRESGRKKKKEEKEEEEKRRRERGGRGRKHQRGGRSREEEGGGPAGAGGWGVGERMEERRLQGSHSEIQPARPNQIKVSRTIRRCYDLN